MAMPPHSQSECFFRFLLRSVLLEAHGGDFLGKKISLYTNTEPQGHSILERP